MSLHIYKYKKYPNQEDLESTNDCIMDLAIVYDVGFNYNPNGREFFKNVFFCFHYCIDKYQNEKNISFDILSSHEQTDSYCYFKESNNFFKDKPKSKKVDIENIQAAIPKAELFFTINHDKDFDSIFSQLKEDISLEQKNSLLFFQKNNVNYDEEALSEFHDLINKHLNKYQQQVKEHLNDFILEHDAIALSQSLSNHNTKNKKMKI